MDNALYLAMTGAKQSMLGQTSHANNLANVNTTGFRADYAQARSMPVYGGDGFPTQSYSMTVNPGTDFSSGPLQETGRELDIAIDGEGWIAVEAPDETEAYTRAGNLKVDPLGRLTTANGLPVMGEGGPISLPPFEKLEIGADGSITIRPLGAGPRELAEIDRIKLVKPDPQTLAKSEDGLIRSITGDVATIDETVGLVSGFLEGSNVNAIESLTEVVALARNYEIQVKMMKTVEENEATSSQLLRES